MLEITHKLSNIFHDTDRKDIFTMTYEFIRSSINEKEIAWHYFTRLLYKKGINNYLDYIGIKKGNSIYASKQINDISLRNILDNKIVFDSYLKDTGIRIPKTLGYNFSYNFFWDGRKVYS